MKGCSTLPLVNGDGKRVTPECAARMPKSKRAILKTMVDAQFEAVPRYHPMLCVFKYADGAKANWTFLTGALPDGFKLIKKFRVAEKCKHAFWDTPATNTTPLESCRFLLRHAPNGIETTMR